MLLGAAWIANQLLPAICNAALRNSCRLQSAGCCPRLKNQSFRNRTGGIALAITSWRTNFYLGAKQMFDAILIFVTVLFFVISWLYVKACDHL
jgi:hypothetical protein